MRSPIVPCAPGRGETAVARSGIQGNCRWPLLHCSCTAREALPAGRPHPECGSRTPRDNSLILVITGVEPGDPGRPCRSAWKSTCGCAVRGDRLSRVDTWTTQELSPPPRRRPPPVPPPAHVPSPGRPRGGRRDVDRSRRRGVARMTKPLVNRLIHPGGQTRRRGRRASPGRVGAHRPGPGFPNLCTSLGTTDRPVDRGHRPAAADDRLPSDR